MHGIGQFFQSSFHGQEFACTTLTCLVVQPFLLAMPADVRLATKSRTTLHSSVVQQG